MGLNHETAPVQVREHFAVNAEQQGTRAKEIIALSTIGEAVVISTCNRMEIYAAVEQADVGIENPPEGAANMNSELYFFQF